jgi:hypothetical protein
MMLGWMVYAVVVALMLGGAAFVAERSAQLRRAPTRWLWAGSILASVMLPVVMSSVAAPTAGGPGGAGGPAPQLLIPFGRRAPRILQPSAWVTATDGGASVEIPDAAISLDAILLGAWAAASAVIGLAIAFGSVRLHQRKRAWTLQLIAGAPVYISEDVGPAVVGLLHPSIVVPRWIADAAPQTQALVVAHERSHLDANDARLLALAVLVLAAVPWNLPLWWQLRRLRFAIEVDCDARVLKAGHDVAHYGEALIMVGERQSGRVSVVAAMSESRSFLEQRISKMLWKPNKLAWASATALAGLGVALAAAAAAVSPPPKLAPSVARLSDAPPPDEAQAVQMKRYTNTEWSFALDVPARWHAFPPAPSNGPFEVIRFISGDNALEVGRQPFDPSTNLDQAVKNVQGLKADGFSNFVTGETTIGSRSARTLTFDKNRPDGKLWSVREYFIGDGSLLYVLSFGTTDRMAMFGLYDRIAKSFTFNEQAS